MATALERIELLEQNLAKQEARLAGTQQFAERAVSMAMNTETATGVLGKTLTAMILIFKDRKVLVDRDILERMQKMDEDEDKRQVKDLLAKKVIASQDTSDPRSLVSVKHILIPKDNPTPITISGYRLTDLNELQVNSALRNALVDKQVGETAKITDDNGDNLFTVIEIYGIAEIQQAGEQLPPTADTPPPAPADAVTVPPTENQESA